MIDFEDSDGGVGQGDFRSGDDAARAERKVRDEGHKLNIDVGATGSADRSGELKVNGGGETFAYLREGDSIYKDHRGSFLDRLEDGTLESGRRTTPANGFRGTSRRKLDLQKRLWQDQEDGADGANHGQHQRSLQERRRLQVDSLQPLGNIFAQPGRARLATVQLTPSRM